MKEEGWGGVGWGGWFKLTSPEKNSFENSSLTRVNILDGSIAKLQAIK